MIAYGFLDALASLDFKLSVSQSLSDSPFSSIKASASTGLSDYFYWFLKVSFCAFGLKETGLPNNSMNIYWGKPVSLNSNTKKLL